MELKIDSTAQQPLEAERNKQIPLESAQNLWSHVNEKTEKISKTIISAALIIGTSLASSIIIDLTHLIDRSKIVSVTALTIFATLAYAFNPTPHLFNLEDPPSPPLKHRIIKKITDHNELYKGLKFGLQVAIPAALYTTITWNNWISSVSLAASMHAIVWKVVQKYAHNYFETHNKVRTHIIKKAHKESEEEKKQDRLSTKKDKLATTLVKIDWIIPVQQAKLITAAVVTIAVHALSSGTVISTWGYTLPWILEPLAVMGTAMGVEKLIDNMEQSAHKKWTRLYNTYLVQKVHVMEIGERNS